MFLISLLPEAPSHEKQLSFLHFSQSHEHVTLLIIQSPFLHLTHSLLSHYEHLHLHLSKYLKKSAHIHISETNFIIYPSSRRL